MNRREAIAALTAMPGLASVQKADLRPEDVIVAKLEPGMRVTDETRARIADTMKQVWPNNKVVVLMDGISIEVVRSAK